MAKILFISSNKEDFKRTGKFFIKLNHESDLAEDINSALQKLKTGNYNVALIYPETLQNPEEIIINIKEYNPLPVIVAIQKSWKRINLSGIIITSDKLADVLFHIEYLLQETQNVSQLPLKTTKHLTEQERENFHRKRHLEITENRTIGFISKLL